MANQEFISAAARIEGAIASILEFAATTGDQEFIERITKLAIKKEIVLELLLDEIRDEGALSECFCRGIVNSTVPNTTIFFFTGGTTVTDVGDVTFTGQVCPACFVEGSALTFTFSDDTPTPDNSFTFVSTSIQAPSCTINPTSISLNFSGLGVVTRADMSTVNVSFSGNLNESTVPGGNDSFSISFSSQEVGNPFNVSYGSPSIPDSDILVEECE